MTDGQSSVALLATSSSRAHREDGQTQTCGQHPRSEIDALLKTIKKNEIQGLLSDIIAAKGGKYTVEVLSITVDDPPSDDTREVNATRMSSEEARTARADAVIIVVVVAICVLCCCGLCIAGRMLHKRHKAKKRAEAQPARKHGQIGGEGCGVFSSALHTSASWAAFTANKKLWSVPGHAHAKLRLTHAGMFPGFVARKVGRLNGSANQVWVEAESRGRNSGTAIWGDPGVKAYDSAMCTLLEF